MTRYKNGIQYSSLPLKMEIYALQMMLKTVLNYGRFQGM